ncbi:MAG: DNA mismatch repair endonuclease MutL [Acidobacteria bacterium]|nr:DNA mismatch repair endonuclease MutL [Acidobacteriota bacterium]
MTTESQLRGAMIGVLAPDLVTQIAAGEVVERPASVVKELIENALDAGATEIEVTLEDGGKTLIEVRDNGCGISSDDAVLALERHATSKIADFRDLTHVQTLGFRGEALPSIASVSRFSLVTSDGSTPAAISVEKRSPVEPPVVRPAARDCGTTVRVEHLFHHVPARRKFLKSTNAEFRAISGIVNSYALPSPHRAFRLFHHDRLVIDLPAVRTLRERIVQVLGSEVDPHLAPIEFSIGSSRAGGFVSRGGRVGGRKNQFFFVNGRLVRDRVLMQAARRAVESFDIPREPAIVMFLSVDPEEVDVNVHPGKTEVRFRDSGRMFVVTEQGIKRALAGPEGGAGLLNQAPQRDLIEERPDQKISQPLFRPEFRLEGRADPGAWSPLFRSRPLVQPPLRNVELPSIDPAPDPERFGDLRGRVIGQYRLSYILVDIPDGLRLVDQHVAHERVLFDRIEAGFGETAETQTLLTPLVHEVGSGDAAILESHLDELRQVGFDIERFSGNSFAISAIPSILGNRNVATFLKEIVDRDGDRDDKALSRIRERVIASLACQAAIKVHRPLGGHEMSQLVSELLRSSNPYACPHGRPIIVDIQHPDIERHFHRR